MKKIITSLLLVFTFTISANASCETESFDTTNVLVCDQLVWNNLFITVSGDYEVTLFGANSVGCDSIVHLHAIIQESTANTDTQTACDTYTWLAPLGNDLTYDSSGVYTHTTTNAAGCDHVETLDLTIYDSYLTVDTQVHCNAYTWIDGNEYTSSNTTSQYPLLSVDGCDSTIYLHLTINDSTFNTNPQTACDTYTWLAPLGDGTTYDTTGVYTHLSIDPATGCIHEETLNLTINYSTSGTTTVTECDTYTWAGPLGNGNTYNTSGTFTITNVSANAALCDHTETLELTINLSSDTTDINEIVCNSFTDALGNIYDTTSIYTYVLTNASGCDSVIRLDLTVNFPDSSFIADSSCNSYTWNGITYDTTGVYYFNTTTFGGCDSVAVLDLFVGYDEINTTVVNACDNFVWKDANGDTIFTPLNSVLSSGGGPGNYGTDGIYIDTIEYTNVGGCDSIEILNLTINSSSLPSSLLGDIYACESWTNPFDGEVIEISGTISIVIGTTSSGCDSLGWYNINLATEKRDDIIKTECDTFTWIIANDQGGVDTTAYTASAEDSTVYSVTHYFTPTDSITCDSIVYLHLTITNSETTLITDTACDSYYWSTTDSTYTSSTNDTVVLTTTASNNAGCDSTVTLNLTINDSTSTTDIQTACGSYTWAAPLGDGNTYTSSGVYTNVSTNTAGCNHIETLVLTIDSVYAIILPAVTACEEYSWNFSAGGNGVTYYSSGQYTSQFQSIDGCDSLIILDLIIDHPDSIIDVIDTCDSYTWIDGVTYTSSDSTAFHVLPTALGVCDSTIYLHLTINNSTSTYTPITECDSYTWAVNGTTYYTTGLFIVTSTNASGCLHTDSLDLTINSSSSGATAHTACDSYTWDGQLYTQSGIYPRTFLNAANCDSIHTLTLTIDNTNVYHDTATACYAYEWTPDNHPLLTFGFDTTSTFSAGNNELIHIVTGNSTGITTTCTDTAYLYLTINPMVYVSTSVSVCDDYDWNGNTYTTSGIFIDTMPAVTTCDSVVTLTLTVRESTFSDTTITACDTLAFQSANGTDYFSTSGDHDVVISSVAGGEVVAACTAAINNGFSGNFFGVDSTYAANNQALFVDSTEISVNGSTYFIDHLELNSSNCNAGIGLVYIHGFLNNTVESEDYWSIGGNSVGCDSTITIHLTVLESTESFTDSVVCDSVLWNNTWYSSTGMHSWSILGGNAVGCDTTAWLDLTVNNSWVGTENIVECISYMWGGVLLTSDTTLTTTLTTVDGCDSIVTLNLTIGGVFGCTDPLACNYDVLATCDDGICILPDGCTDSTAFNYDATATCDDGSCIAIVYGCTDPSALNYCGGCNIDDGSCVYVAGCTDATACNYDPLADFDNGSCILPDGCMDATALNYDPLATCDDGSCIYPTWNCINGSCIDPGTGNGTYSSLAVCNAACIVVTSSWDCNNGVCSDPGTGNGTYSSLAVCNAACIVVTSSWDCNNGVCSDPGTGNGTYASLAACNAACVVVTPSWDCNNGVCSDPGTGNGAYSSLAACQAVCILATPSWDCNNGVCSDPGTGNGTYSSLAACQAVCGIVSGCMDSLACNYNPLAIQDDGSCSYSTYYSTDSVGIHCGTFTWIDGITYTSTNNTATMTYTTNSGCDSVITLDLIIYNSPSVVIVQNTADPSLWDAIANGGVSPYSYAWSGLQFSSSASTVGPLENGHYCVEVTDANGCISNSDCIDILPSSIYDHNLSEFNVYPNPTSDVVNFEFTAKTSMDYSIQIITVDGVKVYDEKLLNHNGYFKGKLDLSSFAKGTYLVQIIFDNNIVYRKVLNQ